MPDDGLRQRFRRAFSDERSAPGSFHLALSQLDKGRPSVWTPTIKLLLGIVAIALLAGVPAGAWITRHNTSPSAASPARVSTQSPDQQMASPTPLTNPSSGPPARIEPVVGRTYHDKAGHIESLVRWDFPDSAQHKLIVSWSPGTVSTWSDSAEMGPFQFLGSGVDGHSMAVLVSRQGWARFNLTPIGAPSPAQLDLVAWETNPADPWRLAETYDDGLDLVGFMTLDGPRAAAVGQMVTYRLDWKTNEARLIWFGSGGASLELVSHRFVSGTGQLVGGGSSPSQQPKLFSFSSATGTLEITFRVVGQPGLAFVRAFLGGTDVCCETNIVQVTVLT